MNEEFVPLCDILSFFLINNKGIFHWNVKENCFVFPTDFWGFWRLFFKLLIDFCKVPKIGGKMSI